MSSRADLDRWARGGLYILRGLVTHDEQADLARACRTVVAQAPFARPHMPDGTPFRCDVTGAGEAVFFAKTGSGYYYAKTHPVTGAAWPPVPPLALDIATRAMITIGEEQRGFDALLINRYRADHGENLGLHNDTDEPDLEAPIVTISLGADCEFVVGGDVRFDKAGSIILSSGDVVVMARSARLWYHAVKRVMPVMVSPIAHGTRLGLSVRKVS